MAEQPKVIQQAENIPQTVEEAVDALIVEYNEDKAIGFLRTHPDQVSEFCLKTVEAYRVGDKAGVVQLAMIIKKLL